MIIDEEYFRLCKFNNSTERMDGGVTQYILEIGTAPTESRLINSLINTLKTDFDGHINDMLERISITSKYIALRYGFIKNFKDVRTSTQLIEQPIPMSDAEITKLLKQSVEFTRQQHCGAIEHHFIADGYHRAWAMIHRLAHDQPYIPFYQRSDDDK